MYANYDLTLLSSVGARIAQLDAFSSLTYARSVNNVGAASVTVPFDARVWAQAGRDSILEIWRTGANRKRALGAVWLLSGRSMALASDGTETMTLTYVDQLDVLNRYSIYAQPTDSNAVYAAVPAESLIKSVVRSEVLTANTAVGRLGLGSYITMEPDEQRGAAVSAQVNMQNVLAVAQNACQTSAQAGLYLCFDMEPQTALSWQFCCYSGQRGVDRSAGSPYPLFVSAQGGRASERTYSENYLDSASTAICGGQVASGAQVVAVATDAALDSLGPFAHTETYSGAQNTADQATIYSQAQAALRAGRPSYTWTGTFVETASARWGRDIDFGDTIMVSAAGRQQAMRIEGVSVSVDSGTEKITLTAQGQLS